MPKKGEIVNRIGEENISNEGYKMKIVEYNKSNDIWIEFQDEYKAKVHTRYDHFKKGEVKNPYHPSVFGIGYFGQGKYKSRGKDRKKTKAYIHWRGMLERCYDPYKLNKYPTYRNCIVCEEWLNFQNFCEWFYKHYYEAEGERMCLDKDILFKNNKIYSSETCMIVPERINTLFINQQRSRGEYPIGVSKWLDKRNGHKWLIVQCNITEGYESKLEHLGRFPLNRPFQAFYTYKIYKENYIKQVAEEYKDLIPKELYDALYRYEVEIND